MESKKIAGTDYGKIVFNFISYHALDLIAKAQLRNMYNACHVKQRLSSEIC